MSEARPALRSEELRAALDRALSGEGARLAELLARHGGLPGPRPNLALAAGFGEAIADAGKAARPVLAALAREPADLESARVFLPIAAAFGYAARLAKDPKDAWPAVLELAADDRPPVRVGLIAALVGFVSQSEAHVDALVAEASAWLDAPDRDHVYAAQGIALDVLSDRRAVVTRADAEALFAWLDRTLDGIADAPRAAERSPARRHLFGALPSALAEVASSVHGGTDWLIARATELSHEDLRTVFSRTLEALRRGARAQPPEVLAALEAALASTAKVPRDPTRLRDGTGRGKKGRRRSR